MKIYKMYFYSFIDTFFIYIPYLALFLTVNKGLSNNQIAIVLSGFSFSVFIFEIPTGFIADKIGAKQSIVIGFCIRLTGLVILTFANSFINLVISEVLLGLGATFCSGADQSLLYKIVNTEKENYGKIVSNYYTISWIGLTVSFLCGQVLAMISYNQIFYISIVFTFIGLILSITLPNVKTLEKAHDSLDIIKYAIGDILNNKKLTAILLLGSFILAVLATSYLLFQPYLNEINMANKNNGLMFFFVTLFAIFGSKFQPYIAKKSSSINNISLLFLLSITIVVIGISSGFIVIVFFCLFRFIWGITSPYISKEINEFITKEQSRSTILSIQSLLSNLMQGLFLLFAGSIKGTISSKLLFLGLIVFILGIIMLIRTRKLTIAST